MIRRRVSIETIWHNNTRIHYNVEGTFKDMEHPIKKKRRNTKQNCKLFVFSSIQKSPVSNFHVLSCYSMLHVCIGSKLGIPHMWWQPPQKKQLTTIRVYIKIGHPKTFMFYSSSLKFEFGLSPILRQARLMGFWIHARGLDPSLLQTHWPYSFCNLSDEERRSRGVKTAGHSTPFKGTPKECQQTKEQDNNNYQFEDAGTISIWSLPK